MEISWSFRRNLRTFWLRPNYLWEESIPIFSGKENDKLQFQWLEILPSLWSWKKHWNLDRRNQKVASHRKTCSWIDSLLESRRKSFKTINFIHLEKQNLRIAQIRRTLVRRRTYFRLIAGILQCLEMFQVCHSLYSSIRRFFHLRVKNLTLRMPIPWNLKAQKSTFSFYLAFLRFRTILWTCLVLLKIEPYQKVQTMPQVFKFLIT